MLERYRLRRSLTRRPPRGVEFAHACTHTKQSLGRTPEARITAATEPMHGCVCVCVCVVERVNERGCVSARVRRIAEYRVHVHRHSFRSTAGGTFSSLVLRFFRVRRRRSPCRGARCRTRADSSNQKFFSVSPRPEGWNGWWAGEYHRSAGRIVTPGGLELRTCWPSTFRPVP